MYGGKYVLNLTLKSFFIKEGKQRSNEKYGLISHLEYLLNDMYRETDSNFTLNYQRVKSLKSRIDQLKSEILEGVQVRSRIQEIKYGEIPSSYLVGKQSSEGKKKTIHKLTTEHRCENFQLGIDLDNTDDINKYVYSFYNNLYTAQENNSSVQNEFINHLQTKVSEIDNETLTEPLDLDEIDKALNSTENHKSPGIDGLPYEFYKTFWDILKYDLHEILTYMITNLSLTQSQSLGIITLQPKSGNKTLLSNWRPITLMTCDYKILTKVFANRLKCIIPRIISNEQFCCPGKSIIDSNLVMRDVLYYCNENNIQGAVLSLDWSKAYDRVDHNFVYAVSNRLGFCESFIKIVKLFCSNVRSVVQINGNLTKTFYIGRGIRQGCPMSMIVYVLFKEALYCHIKSLHSIKGPELPNGNSLKILGYADDTNLILRDNVSIIEAVKIIKKFENATGAILNEEKTIFF